MTKAADIRAAIRAAYPAQEFALAFEVAQATGSKANRHLDCVVMSLWPSRGLSLHGIEIKVSRSDWRRELKEPEKAEEIARFLDYFSIAAPKGVVPIDEMPDAWGLMEVDNGKLRTAKRPTRTEAAPITREFMAAMMRAAQRPIDGESLAAMISKEREKIYEKYSEDLDRRVKERDSENSRDAESWRNLLMSLGENPNTWFGASDVISAIKMVRQAGVAETYGGVTNLLRTLSECQRRIDAAVRDARIPVTVDLLGHAKEAVE